VAHHTGQGRENCEDLNGVKSTFQLGIITLLEALDKSKIEDFHFHDIRHTFAGNLVMNGAELNDVRALLGHKDMKMTLRYAHLSPKHKGRVINILDRVFDVSQNPQQTEKMVELKR
jgi:integrase